MHDNKCAYILCYIYIYILVIYSVDDQFSSLIVRRLQEVFLIYTIAGQLYQGTLSPTLRKPRVRFT